jgi:predicted dehydrogenase
MSERTHNRTSRREFLKSAGCLAAGSVLAAGLTPRLYAGENNTIQVALIGCGWRGNGAADNALNTRGGPVKLVAMADIFEDKIKESYQELQKLRADQMDVPEDRRFLGFDGYKKAMDCLKPGDVAILATPPAFRWVHFQYAIGKGLHVFMEKPVSVDGPTTRRMFQLAEEADRKNLKVGVGLMIRHCRGRQELFKRIQDGEIGEILMMRGYRMCGRTAAVGPKNPEADELMWQVRHFHSWIWASGGVYSDSYIHQIDEMSWMKGAWPISAHALGGRQVRGEAVDQNFDNYSVEYTYPDGARLFYQGRSMAGCKNEFASYVHGTKGSAVVSTSGHTPGKVRTYRTHLMEGAEPIWRYTWEHAKGPGQEESPYEIEWNDLMDAIRNDKPYSEVKRGAIASLIASMGRMAAHTGNPVTYEQILNCPHEMAPDVNRFVEGYPAPVRPNAQGQYPQPQPGVLIDREYKEFA